MRDYLRYQFWDWILCTLISIGLSMNVLSGFIIDDLDQRVPMLIVVSAVISFVCLLAAYNRASSIAGIIAGVVVAVILLVISWRNDTFINDENNETQIFYIVAVLMALAVFLVCRWRAGIIVLFLAGNVVCAGASFLEFPCRLWAYILFLAACAAIFFYRTYVRSVLKSRSGKVRFKGFMLQNMCVVLVALLLTCGVYYGIIRPIDPPTDDLTLIQRIMSFELLETLGVSTTRTVLDQNRYSTQEPEEDRTTREMEESREEEIEAGQNLPEDTEEQDMGTELDTAPDQTTLAQAISYALKHFWWVWVIVIAAIIVFLILLRRILRKRWLATIDGLSREDGVYNLYRFFLFGIARSGYKRAPNLTLEEFWELRKNQLSKFDTDGVDFGQLTETYRKVYFGRQPVSEEEYADYLTYYKGFHRHVRKEGGFWRYLILYFRL